eukprot:363143-Hanusia_phi.AAC.1
MRRDGDEWRSVRLHPLRHQNDMRGLLRVHVLVVWRRATQGANLRQGEQEGRGGERTDKAEEQEESRSTGGAGAAAGGE